MTPREIAAALDCSPIAGLTHRYGDGGLDGWLDLRAIADGCPLACASLCADADDLGAVLVVTNAKIESLRVTAETLRADVVKILAWSLGRDDIDPAAPETLAALRTPGLYSEVLRKFLDDQHAAIDAALETST